MSPCVSHTHENQSTSYFWRRRKIKSLVSFLSEIDTWITRSSSAENDRFYCKNAVNILISWHDTPFVPSCGYKHWSGFHFFSTKPRMTHPQLDVFSWLHCSMINSSLLQCQIATEREKVPALNQAYYLPRIEWAYFGFGHGVLYHSWGPVTTHCWKLSIWKQKFVSWCLSI